MHLPQDLEKLLQGHLERYWSVQCCTEGPFEKFSVCEKIWPFEVQWMNYDFFAFFVFCSFGHIFQDISITGQRLCFWDRTGRHLSFDTNFNEIGQNNFFVWKSKAIPLKYLKFSKFKKFCQIKNVNMQIDRNGTQKRCTLNRLKIFQKLRLPWLFKVHRIMQNIWKLELALITLKSASVVGKLISCPF